MMSAYFFQVLVILAGMLGLFGAAAYGLKHLQTKVQKGHRLKIKENLFIDTKRRISIVEYEGREFLMVFGAQQEHIIPLEEKKDHEAKHLQKAA